MKKFTDFKIFLNLKKVNKFGKGKGKEKSKGKKLNKGKKEKTHAGPGMRHFWAGPLCSAGDRA